MLRGALRFCKVVGCEVKMEAIEISDIQQRLMSHARSKCVPFLLDTVLAGEDLDCFAVVLVG